MNQCIGSAMEGFPPRISWAPNPFSILDTGIALQAFVPNVQGCLDNLDHAWLREKGLTAEGVPLSPARGRGSVPATRRYPTETPRILVARRATFDTPSGSFEPT